MGDGVKYLDEISAMSFNAGTPQAQIKDLLGKIRATLGADYEKTKNQVGGGVYELIRTLKITGGGPYTPQDPGGVGDQAYNKNGVLHVRQQKWVTGGSSAVSRNLTSALSQLAGIVQDNPEVAPAGSMAIADIVLTNPPQDIIATFGNTQAMTDYFTDLISKATNAQGSELGNVQTVSVRVFVMTGLFKTDRYCVDVSNGTVTVRAPSSKSRDSIMMSELLIDLLAKDVQQEGRKAVSDAIRQLWSQY
jgi:hypothetical protein